MSSIMTGLLAPSWPLDAFPCASQIIC